MAARDPDTGFITEANPGNDDPVEAYRMPLVEHLRELRHRLIVGLVATGIATAGCFFYAEIIWNTLAQPMNEALVEHNGEMIQLDPLEGFMNYIKVSVLAGFIVASPVNFYQLWKFVAPGLYPKEQKAIMPLAIASSALFVLGAAFGYSVIFEFAFPFFLEITYEGIDAKIPINTYLGLATKLLVAFGACFQLPIVVYFLARIGLVHHWDMINSFRYAIVGIFIVSAMITPPDVISQILMAGPLVVLYGIGIVIAWAFTTKEVVKEE